MGSSALLRVLQNHAAPQFVGNRPFLDLIQGSKAAKTGKVIAQAAIAHARGLSGSVEITH
jgi:hypothetical protein